MLDGASVGVCDGVVLGSMVGTTDGVRVGRSVGSAVGVSVGIMVGVPDWSIMLVDGTKVGERETPSGMTPVLA